jgi:hypothetical protein
MGGSGLWSDFVSSSLFVLCFALLNAVGLVAAPGLFLLVESIFFDSKNQNVILVFLIISAFLMLSREL